MRLFDMVNNQQAHFQYFRDKELWYKTDDDFLFPVPISDVGTATFLSSDKAIFFMKWIRRYKEELDKENDQPFVLPMPHKWGGI